MSPASTRYWTQATDGFEAGAIVCGRRIFDHTSGWSGRPPGGGHTFVVAHRPPPQERPPFPDTPFTFVTDGVASAVAQAKARGNGLVSVCGPNIDGVTHLRYRITYH
jgi:dihydrofolate reductase